MTWDQSLNTWPPAMQTALMHTALMQALIGQVGNETFMLASHLSLACLSSPLSVHTVTDGDLCHLLKLPSSQVVAGRTYLTSKQYFLAEAQGLTLWRYRLLHPRVWAGAGLGADAGASADADAHVYAGALARSSIYILPSGKYLPRGEDVSEYQKDVTILSSGQGEGEGNTPSSDRDARLPASPDPDPEDSLLGKHDQPGGGSGATSGPLVLPANHPSHASQQCYTLAERWQRWISDLSGSPAILQALAEMASFWMGIPVSSASKRLLRQMTTEVLDDGSARGVFAVADAIMRGGQRTIAGNKLDYLRMLCRNVEQSERDRHHRSGQLSGAEAWAQVRKGDHRG